MCSKEGKLVKAATMSAADPHPVVQISRCEHLLQTKAADGTALPLLSEPHAQPYADTGIGGIGGEPGPCINAKLQPLGEAGGEPQAQRLIVSDLTGPSLVVTIGQCH